MNVIMKFGGTSVQDADAMNRVIVIVRNQWAANPTDRPPVVVVSAMSKVTDRLVETGRLAGERQTSQATQIIVDLLTRHLSVAATLVQGPALDELNAQLSNLKKEQFNLRFQRANGQVENTGRIRVLRRDIARIQTVLTEQRRAAPAKG